MGGQQVNGIIIGLVSDLGDPEKLGRVKVKYPTLAEQESDWARLVTPMAGKGRGQFFRPEVGDEVLVAFELGDVRRPYVLGSLWSQADAPPDEGVKSAQNDIRVIRSRSAHLLIFDDTPGKEKIEIVASDGKRKVVIDSANQKIQVTCDSGDVEVKAGAGTVKVDATTVEIKSTGNMTLQASGTMTIKGATVNIN
jgi:uncharacterized protein involved in type VI secretion and phage assembly